MKNYRVIYIIEEITNDGELITRRFARNKRTSMKIANNCKKDEPVIRKAQKKNTSGLTLMMWKANNRPQIN